LIVVVEPESKSMLMGRTSALKIFWAFHGGNSSRTRAF
jgi:hypothetical protein